MTIRDYLVNAVAGAAILGAGSAIVSLKIDTAQQDVRIERIEKLDTKIDQLNDNLTVVNGRLERLEGRLGLHDD